MTDAQDHTAGHSPGSDLRKALLTVACIFTNFYLLLPMVPVLVLADTGSSTVAGSVASTMLIVTVGVQLLMPRVLAAARARMVLAAGLTLLGIPGLLHVVAGPAVGFHFLGAALRGVGFGLSTVTVGVLIVSLSDARRRGRSLGVMGLVSSVPAIAAPPAALWLGAAFGDGTAVVAGFVAGLLGAAVAFMLPDEVYRRERHHGAFRTLVRRHDVLGIVFVFGCAAAVFGALATFVPIILPREGWVSASVWLLLFGLCRGAGRWGSGQVVDLRSTRLVWLPSLLSMIAGLVLVAPQASGLAILAGAVLIGLGFGGLQHVSQYAMFARAESGRYGAANSLWNVSFDTGAAIGAGALGWALAGPLGTGSLWLLPVISTLALAALMVLVWPREPAGWPVPDMTGRSRSTTS